MEPLDLANGDPLMFLEFWQKHKILPEINTRDKILYEYNESDLSVLVEKTHKFHGLFRNDNPGSQIVFGNGSTQVIQAILFTIAKLLGRTITVGYTLPSYMLMHQFLSFSPWVKTVTLTQNFKDAIDVEICIDPHNPLGERQEPLSKATYVIFDRAYHWPIYMKYGCDPCSQQANHFTVYTLSKSLGMGGLRLGYAMINDNDFAQEISWALLRMGICPNSFSLICAEKIFDRFIEDQMLKYSYAVEISAKLEERRLQLITVAKKNNFQVTNLFGPYAWIRITDSARITDSIRSLDPIRITDPIRISDPTRILKNDISQYLWETYHIKVNSGINFGSTKEYARLSLICADEVFMKLIERLQ